MKNNPTATEHAEQAALFQWRDLAIIKHPSLAMLFAIPNGGARHIVVARKLKAEGVKKGVPDTFLAAPRGVYHGLFVEMKRIEGGTVSPEQKHWIGALRAQGYAVAVCYGWEEATRAILNYLTLSDALK